MSIIFFTVPALHPEPGASELNHCLATQRVAQVERSFVADGSASFWAVCVTVLDSAGGRRGERPDERGDAARRRGAVDYRELLSADEFALYDRLRSARKQAAEVDGLPTYAVFTNEQLAAMVRGRVASADALAAIEGVGAGRVGRYGDAFLALLREGVARLGGPSAPLAGEGG